MLVIYIKILKKRKNWIKIEKCIYFIFQNNKVFSINKHSFIFFAVLFYNIFFPLIKKIILIITYIYINIYYTKYVKFFLYYKKTLM